jgi:hypothetical protein
VDQADLYRNRFDLDHQVWMGRTPTVVLAGGATPNWADQSGISSMGANARLPHVEAIASV